ncbi:MAG: hypothetical protein HYY05_06435 [Chloroflexi bacterium]|nr:hypothetical protein [Chloroflexota bacterium]
MSFNWAEYLSLAEILCGVPVSGPPVGIEAQQRAGVSRAYYAGYVSAHNRLRDVDGVRVPTAENPHGFVRRQYTNDPDPRRRYIGIALGRLGVARNRCDYDDDVRELPHLTRRSLARAAQILADLKRL